MIFLFLTLIISRILAVETLVFGCEKDKALVFDKSFINITNKNTVCHQKKYLKSNLIKKSSLTQPGQIHMSVFMGYLKPTKSPEERDFYFKNINHFFRENKISSNHNLLSIYNSKHDPIYYHLLVFLKHLPNLVEIKSLAIENTDDLNIKIYANSKSKNYEINIFLADTDLNKKNEGYLNSLIKSFSTSHIISYLGHAKNGENLAFSKLIDLKKLKFKDYLSFGIFSCNAIEQFDASFLDYLKNLKGNTLFTTTDEKAGARFILGQLQYFENEKLGMDFFKKITPLNEPFIITFF